MHDIESETDGRKRGCGPQATEKQSEKIRLKIFGIFAS
jgi:hypothetical protein